MTRYLTTRKRNIKKYKKSRTGRDKGRRSIRRCKTRKPKIFMKKKKNNVSKRRMMVGGLDCEGYMFQVKPNDVHHSKQFLDIFTPPEKTLTLIGYCIAFVTKLDGRFNADNRPEYLVFFRYGDDDIVIVRAECPIKIAEIKFPNSVPNYTPFIIGVLRVPLNKDIFEGISENADKYNIPLTTVNELLRKLKCSSMSKLVEQSMFKSYVIRPTKGLYRIVVCNDENSLFTPRFTPKVTGLENTQNDSTNISKLLENVVELGNDNDSVKTFFRLLPEIQYPIIDSSSSLKKARELLRMMDPLQGSQPPGGFYTPNDTPEAEAAMNAFELDALPNKS